jgi:hypothetical protein
MAKLIVSEFMTMDGVMQAPGGKDEDRDGGFQHGGWTVPYWHDDIGKSFLALMQDVDEERGPAVSREAKQARARKMIRELRSLGYQVQLVSPAPTA